MNKQFSGEYLKVGVHFFDSALSEILENLLRSLKNFSLIDLGCGDGRLLYSMYRKGLLKNAEKVVGLDISEERIRKLRTTLPFINGITADVQNMKKIRSGSFDLVVSSQVIEHVPNDIKMLKEVYRILKPNGHFYVSTVIKKWYGFWIYWKNGFKLDVTHVREYRTEEEFLNILKNNGFGIIEWKIDNVSYPILDLLIRLLIRLNLVEPSPSFYLRHDTLRNFRNKLKLKVVGYKTIEVLGVKQ